MAYAPDPLNLDFESPGGYTAPDSDDVSFGTEYEDTIAESLEHSDTTTETIYHLKFETISESLAGTAATITVVAASKTALEALSVADAVLLRLQFGVTEPLVVTDASSYSFQAAVIEAFRTSSAVSTNATMQLTMAEDLKALDRVIAGAGFTLAESLSVTDIVLLGIFIHAIDSMVIVDSVIPTAAKGESLANALICSDLLRGSDGKAIIESLALTDSEVDIIRVLLAVSEPLVVAGDGVPTFRIYGDVSESLGVTSAVLSKLTAGETAADSVLFGGVLNLPEGSYYAWAVNTETAAPTQYENYPFNSLASINDRFFGVATDGLYELTGDDDAGTQIDGYIQTGLTDFGTNYLKRVVRAYIGYTSDGRILLKTTSTSGGQKVERWYEVPQHNADAAREARVAPARGIKARYWQFELTNADGDDFELVDITLKPLILKRRV